MTNVSAQMPNGNFINQNGGISNTYRQSKLIKMKKDFLIAPSFNAAMPVNRSSNPNSNSQDMVIPEENETDLNESNGQNVIKKTKTNQVNKSTTSHRRLKPISVSSLSSHTATNDDESIADSHQSKKMMNSNRSLPSKKNLISLAKSQLPPPFKYNEQKKLEAIGKSDNDESIDFLDAYLNHTDIDKSNIHHDLYKQTPTITFIKEKYKQYLEWLNENQPQTSQNLSNSISNLNNSSKHNFLSKTSNNSLITKLPTNNSNSSSNLNQLTWYCYERSLKSLNDQQKHPTQVNLSHSKTFSIKKQAQIVENNSMFNSSTNSSDLSQSTISTSSNEQSTSKGVKFNPSYLSLKKINQFNTSKNNKLNNITYHIDDQQHNPSASNNSTPLLHTTNLYPIKPILKSKSNNLSNSNNDISGLMRRDSLVSLDSNPSSSKLSNLSNLNSKQQVLIAALTNKSTNQSVNKMNSGNYTLVSSLFKLPPITRGSDDFMQVMQELKGEKGN